MNPSVWICCFFPLLLALLLFWEDEKQRKLFCHKKIVNRKRKQGGILMNELISQYVGKECIVYTFQQQVAGVVTAVEPGWLAVEHDGKTEVLNLDFITRIREYPTNKKGKKKSVIVD